MSSNPIKQPKIVARSPMIVAMIPMSVNEVTNLSQPENIAVGGINANKTFQKNDQKCSIYVNVVAFSKSPPFTVIAVLICSTQLCRCNSMAWMFMLVNNINRSTTESKSTRSTQNVTDLSRQNFKVQNPHRRRY